MQSVQNLGLALISILTGVIVDEAGYFVLEVFFLGMLCGKFLVILQNNYSKMFLKFALF
jgi:hypothetical protein